MKCIICKKERQKFTKEHIVPESIGGSLVINNVCKECNDYLGYKIESAFVNSWLIETKKYKHKIKGKRKTLKHPLGTGKLKSDPERSVTFLSDKNGMDSKIIISPKIELEDGRVKFDVGSNEKEENIVQMVNKKLTRNGKNPLSNKEEKELLKSIEKYKTKSPNKQTIEVILTKEMDAYAHYRVFAKIAYELGFYFLGDEYLNDKTGESLRKFILDEKQVIESAQKHQIEGKIQLIDPKEKIEKKIKEIKENDRFHILAVFRNKYIISVYIRIFSMYEGNIIISRTPANYDKFNSDGYLVLMDSTDNSFEIMESGIEHLAFILKKFPQ